MVYNGKPYSNGWFGGTTIFGNIHLLLLLGANIYCIPAEFLQTGLISLDRSWCPLQVVRRQNLCSWISPKYYLLWRIVPPYVKMLEIYMVYRRYIWYIEGIYDISPLNSPPPQHLQPHHRFPWRKSSTRRLPHRFDSHPPSLWLPSKQLTNLENEGLFPFQMG